MVKIRTEDKVVDTSSISKTDVLYAEIEDITKDELLNPEFIPSIFSNYNNENERDEVLTQVLARAGKLKIKTKVKKMIDECSWELLNRTSNNVYNLLVVNNMGEPEPTIDNYYNVMKNDKAINNCFRFDEFSGQYQYYDAKKKKVRPWTDSDDSNIRKYIETKYHFCNIPKYVDAFNVIMNENKYHPIKDIIEQEDWDGEERIDRFLVDILGCDDDDYSREVARMIFYGGISRLYNPGCKFDYMPIFISAQGIGKSTIVRWLALDDKYYREVTTIDGKEGIEAIQGGWMCEFAELLAMIRAREVEAMKSFVTRTTDTYRKAYGRHTSYCERTCIFIGTTNDYQFLVDKTGNRRYLPIEINLEKGELFRNEKYVKEYILNCWREALYLYRKKKTYMTIPVKYNEIVETKSNKAVEDDPIVGMIEDYLEQKEEGYCVCGLEIFTECLNNLKKNYTKQEGRNINMIIRRMSGWKPGDVKRFEKYGRQRCWIKDSNYVEPTRKMNIRKKKVGDDLD